MARSRPRWLAPTLATLGAISAPAAAAAQSLETETARPLGRGVLEVSGNFEYQTSSEGHEAALPFAFEYGLSDRLEILVEPVAYTAIRPNVGQRATGVGDVEVTATGLLRRETSRTPAVALAAELKLPTAGNSLIGTGKTDIAGYLIASKRFGRLDAHANVAYTVVGRPAGAQLKNIFSFALGGEWRLGLTNAAFAEILGNTAASSTPEPTGPQLPETATPEAPAGEIVGTVGLAHYFVARIKGFVGVSLDNNGAVQFRPGFTLRY